MANGKAKPASISCQIGTVPTKSAEIVHVYKNVITNPEKEISKNRCDHPESDEKSVKSGRKPNKNSEHHASEDSVARGVLITSQTSDLLLLTRKCPLHGYFLVKDPLCSPGTMPGVNPH